MGDKNAYLKKKAYRERALLDAGIDSGAQRIIDYLQCVLHDPEVMGKDAFGPKRLRKVLYAPTKMPGTATGVTPSATRQEPGFEWVLAWYLWTPPPALRATSSEGGGKAAAPQEGSGRTPLPWCPYIPKGKQVKP